MRRRTVSPVSPRINCSFIAACACSHFSGLFSNSELLVIFQLFCNLRVHEGGYGFPAFVCLFVCLLATLRKNCQSDVHENSTRADVSVDNEELI